MDENTIVIERATSLIKSCKVPRLARSVDEAQLQPATFQTFLAIINDRLPKIFDLISQHEAQLVSHDDFNQDNLEFRLSFVLIITEQLYVTGETYDFQTDRHSLQEQINRIYDGGLMEQLLTGSGSDRLLKRLWDHYQLTLCGKEWFYNPADVLSFVRICEFLYGNLLVTATKLPQTISSFILSVGISLTEYHDPEYELLGLRLFNVLLNETHSAILKELNIHQVVFDSSFKLNAKSKSEKFLRELWRCYFQYIKIAQTGRKDFSEWTALDDVLEALLDGLAFEQNLSLSSILLLYLLKFLTLDLPDFLIDDLDDIQAIDSRCHLYEPVLEQLRKYCSLEFHNRRFYRWHRRLLSILPFELEKSCGSSRDHGKYMHGVNLLFVLVVFPIESEAAGQLLDMQLALLDFIIAFKRHMREQYARIQALTGKCDFLHSLKASVSCDKSIAVFARQVAVKYFDKKTEFWNSIGTSDTEESYQEDRIFYECLKELQSRC
ncbi:uncharacterized protein LOC129718020 [Wyeomyia smithii]|uniref:uncharacterized protein LOC129718020 n=1 Tax=Wyeomyia smithii TaxID=174621 RepID=UPI002468214A|nr:uncharacterized protein LOC129718020 [Wyeomyia smithii]XP_055524383.1 uncharacterized protein LOC129718020 [Wyeomyia smithii]XP_055524392.1 uncharacterized protein LOC129718020 [Wyeomyia smithii]